MRLRNYSAALPDLNKALVLNPNYIQALMNRGDIHNYYYAIDRRSAIADYEKVIALGGTRGTSVCGHLFMAAAAFMRGVESLLHQVAVFHLHLLHQAEYLLLQISKHLLLLQVASHLLL